MKTKQLTLKVKDLNSATIGEISSIHPQIGFIFASDDAFQNTKFIELLSRDSKTKWVGCSTAGEVSQKGVTDNTAILTGIHFDNSKSKFKIATATILNADESEKAGRQLADQLVSPDLRSMIVISPGVTVNGSLLIQGITRVVGSKVTVTGGLAGDGGKFQKTYTLSPAGVGSDQVIGIGFYGDSVHLNYGCMGGWDSFGKTRKVTKSKLNVVYELDGKPALDIYKEYLGDHAKDLPSSGLMFPFAILNNQQADTGLIRTILAVDEKTGSLTFAGDVAQGCHVRLMHANTSGLVEGAKVAAKDATAHGVAANAFAMIVSCVGRKLVMGANVDEEIEAISDVFGPGCLMTGFYSYGEISPFVNGSCQLHNQTMTISYISES